MNTLIYGAITALLVVALIFEKRRRKCDEMEEEFGYHPMLDDHDCPLPFQLTWRILWDIITTIAVFGWVMCCHFLSLDRLRKKRS
jgi:hypothetical protein